MRCKPQERALRWLHQKHARYSILCNKRTWNTKWWNYQRTAFQRLATQRTNLGKICEENIHLITTVLHAEDCLFRNPTHDRIKLNLATSCYMDIFIRHVGHHVINFLPSALSVRNPNILRSPPKRVD